MRASMEGCVEKKQPMRSDTGLSLKNASIREGTSRRALAWILRKALTSASGLLVSSAEPVSARNSPVRDRAKRIRIDSPQLLSECPQHLLAISRVGPANGRRRPSAPTALDLHRRDGVGGADPHRG